MPSGIQESLFKDLAADLPDDQRAEFFRTLHEAGIGPDDVELARLLRTLQLYRAYYETIPAAVREAAGEIDRLKQEMERISADVRITSDTDAQLTGQVIREAERIRQDLTRIHEHVEAAMRQSAESLASQMSELLRAGIENTVLLPLQNRLADLSDSNQALEDAITRSNQAATVLEKNSRAARRIQFGAYAFGGLLAVCSLGLSFWFYLHNWYAGRIEQERAALVKQVEKNRAVLLELSRSHRTLELMQDPDHPNRKLLVMKDASGWQSTRKHGVIEFNE